MSDVARQRDAAVREAVARIREIARRDGVTRPSLEWIRDELESLAAQRELFPLADFPPAESGGRDKLYRLSVDPDDRFALYLNRGCDGHATPPHDHTTWAIVVGVLGQERNKVYRRTDDGSVPGRAEIDVAWERTVEPGAGICLMPDDIHSIHMEGDDPKMHLHMYGLALSRLTERVMYDRAAGTYKRFDPPPIVPAAGNPDG